MKVYPISQFKQSNEGFNRAEVNSNNKLIIPVGQQVHFIDFEKITFAYAVSNYIYVISKDRKYFLAKTLKWLGERLPSPTFIRVHRSYIINTNHIAVIDKSTWKIDMSDKTIIPVSKSGRSRLNPLLRSI